MFCNIINILRLKYLFLLKLKNNVNSKIRVTKKAHIIVTNYGNYYIGKGYSFYNTGLILYELFEKYIRDLEIIAVKYAIPMCTNFCLSIELSFKIIMNRFEEVYERKHNLLLLFNNFSDILKKIIIETMKSTGYDEKDFCDHKF